MGTLFKLKSFYVRTFTSQKYQEYFIVKNIFEHNTIVSIQWFEFFFHELFNESFYNYLFEASVYKKNLQLVQYLIDKTNFNLPQQKILLSSLNHQLLTQNLKEKNYFSWLAIIASHSNLQLLGLEKQYHYEDYFIFISYLFKHNILKQQFNNDITKKLILENCHKNAQKMFENLFLELKLSCKNNKAPQNVVPYKVKKI